MKQALHLLVALIAVLAFSATAAKSAVAGLRTVPAFEQADAAAMCEADGAGAARFIVVTCKKKARGGAAVPCPGAQAILPQVLPPIPAARRGLAPDGAVSVLAERRHDELLRPPRA